MDWNSKTPKHLFDTPVVKEEHDGVEVWVNKATDDLCKEQCLCLCCKGLPTCIVAGIFRRECKDHDMVLMVARCPNWDEVLSGKGEGK